MSKKPVIKVFTCGKSESRICSCMKSNSLSLLRSRVTAINHRVDGTSCKHTTTNYYNYF